MNTHGFYHFYERKESFKKKMEEYIFRDTLKRNLDKAIYFVAVATPILTIPQILLIWIEKDASGVSLITWISYFIAAFFWLFYGIVHRATPIIITNSLWIVLKAFVIVGIFLYR